MRIQDLTPEQMEEYRIRGRAKYHKDAEFIEPVVRCDACQKLLLREVLTKTGLCDCGNTRVRNLRSLASDEEMMELCDLVESGKVDPEFALLLMEVQP